MNITKHSYVNKHIILVAWIKMHSATTLRPISTNISIQFEFYSPRLILQSQ